MPTQVLCPGMPAADYCDCGGDCTNQPSFCACGEARQCCAAGGFGVGGGNSSGFPDLQQLCTSGLFSTVMQLDPAWTSATMASYEQCICGGGITAGMLDGSNPAGMITALCSNPCVGMFPDMVLGGVRASLGDDSPISSTATDAELRTCMCSGSPPVIAAMASDSPDLSVLASTASCAPIMSLPWQSIGSNIPWQGIISSIGSGVGGGNSSGLPEWALQQLCTSGLFSTVMQLDPAWTSATMASYEQCICGGGITAGMLDGSNPAGMITALCSNPCVGMFPDMVLGGVRASLGDDSPISSTATDAELRTCMCSGSPPVIVAMASDSPDLSMLSAPSCAPATTIRQVGTVAIAAGDVSDYTPTVVLGMRQNVANLVGAPLEAVTIAVASASVEITITITATEEQLAEGLEAHRAALSDPAQLSTILSTPSFPVTVTEVSQPPTMLTPEGTPVVQEKKDNSLEVGVIVAIVAGIIVLLVVSCALAAYCGKPTNKQPTTVVQMTDIEKTSHPVA